MKKTPVLVAVGALGITLGGAAVLASVATDAGPSPRSAGQVAAATALKKSDYGPWSSHFANGSLRCRTYASAGTSGGRVWHYGKIECNKRVAMIDVVSGTNPGKPAISQHLCRDVTSCETKAWVNNPSGNQSWSVTTTGSVGTMWLSGERLSAHVTFRA
ncbi:hypothetical protein [Actinomadura decatromicini]|uniref:Uncharacterized protein n=1 Tax=Actinomadura decatromicini TaxID=2604572 RepID=A0A5D3FZ57_9ACTN|nr:hypothetical protein [Actinomadura decatromicini]TYK53216.1 hypothetical protein FXF68_05725 [Actinomadura decatromicini]